MSQWMLPPLKSWHLAQVWQQMHSGTSQHPRQLKELVPVPVLTGRQLPRPRRPEPTGRAPPQQQQHLQLLQPLLHPPCSMLTPRTSQPGTEERAQGRSQPAAALQACG